MAKAAAAKKGDSRIIQKFSVFDVLNYILMFLFVIVVIYPFWDLLMRSLSAPEVANKLGFALFPEKWSLGSYRAIFMRGNVGTQYFNTIFRTVVGTAISLAVTSAAAFALAKKELPFRTVITFIFVFTMFFSGGMIPSFLLIKELGLIDTRWALILPGVANVYNMVLTRNYIQSLDSGLEESAMLDGANQFTIFTRIILPVCKPILATVALWLMVGHWNAWFDALLYTNLPSLQVLQLALRNMLVQASSTELNIFMALSGDTKNLFTPESLKAAQIYISITPILCVYPFLQKYFVKGIMVGSFKG